MNKIELSGEAIMFLKNNPSRIVLDDDTVYVYLPFWFKKTDKYFLEVCSLDQLPKELADELIELRDYTLQ
jgi:hypothetical protein